MQKDLSRLIGELQKETCPQRVRNEVRGRISARTSSPGWLRLAWCSGTGIMLATSQVIRHVERLAELTGSKGPSSARR